MCTKECCMVLTRSKPFWGQFWGQIFETDSRTLQSNKCAVFVPLRNADTNITRFSHRKSPTNRYIRFTSGKKLYESATPQQPRTPPPSPREMPLFGRIRTASASMPARPYTAPNSLPLGLFSQERLFLRRLCPDGFHLYRKSLH